MASAWQPPPVAAMAGSRQQQIASLYEHNAGCGARCGAGIIGMQTI
jgi:hypothetical protein